MTQQALWPKEHKHKVTRFKIHDMTSKNRWWTDTKSETKPIKYDFMLE